MKDETEFFEAWRAQRSRPAAGPLPSVRIPVTRENRTRLRYLRAAELVRWESLTARQAGEISRAAGAPGASPRSF
jgi:hypothetical protein